MVDKLKKNSKVALMLNEMLTGYKIKDRFRELCDTFNYKRKNVELRQSNDRDLQLAQDQVETRHFLLQCSSGSLVSPHYVSSLNEP